MKFTRDLNGTKMTMIFIILSALLYINYATVKHFYYRAYYTGCVDLADSYKNVDADLADYSLFKCNFYTKKKMFEWGDAEEILLFTDVFPDKD